MATFSFSQAIAAVKAMTIAASAPAPGNPTFLEPKRATIAKDKTKMVRFCVFLIYKAKKKVDWKCHNTKFIEKRCYYI